MIKRRLEGFTVMNMEDLGHKGRLQTFPNVGSFIREKGIFIG
jgi:hypothetical protein